MIARALSWNALPTDDKNHASALDLKKMLTDRTDDENISVGFSTCSYLARLKEYNGGASLEQREQRRIPTEPDDEKYETD